MTRQVPRFVFIGVLATLLHVGVVIALVEALAVNLYLANVFAWTAALLFSYLGHYHWTFERQSEGAGAANHDFHLPRFVLVSLTGLTLNVSMVAIIYDQLGGSYLAATFGGVSISVIGSYLLNRFWVFVDRV